MFCLQRAETRPWRREISRTSVGSLRQDCEFSVATATAPNSRSRTWGLWRRRNQGKAPCKRQEQCRSSVRGCRHVMTCPLCDVFPHHCALSSCIICFTCISRSHGGISDYLIHPLSLDSLSAVLISACNTVFHKPNTSIRNERKTNKCWWTPKVHWNGCWLKNQEEKIHLVDLGPVNS